MKFKRNILAAAVVFLIGLGTVVHSLQYSIGTLARLGPGAFPLMIGIGLLLISVFLLFEGDDSAEEGEGNFFIQIRGWGLVVAGAVIFIVLGRHGGLIPATFGSVFVASMGDRGNSVASAGLLATGVTVFSVIVFHFGLNIPIPLLRWW